MYVLQDKIKLLTDAAGQIPEDRRRHLIAIIDAALQWAYPDGVPAMPSAPAADKPRTNYRNENGEKWSETYDVTCPHFGPLVRSGGCSCGSGNVHICHDGGDHEVRRGDCQRCWLNTAPDYGRLLLGYGCSECAQVKLALAERLSPDRVKSLLANNWPRLRCVTLLEDEQAEKPFKDKDRLYHVKNIPDYLAESRLPATARVPVLMWRGELIDEPAAIAAKVIEISELQ